MRFRKTDSSSISLKKEYLCLLLLSSLFFVRQSKLSKPVAINIVPVFGLIFLSQIYSDVDGDKSSNMMQAGLNHALY